MPMKRISFPFRRTAALLLLAAMLLSLTGTAFAEDAHQVRPYLLAVYGGKEAVWVRAYDASYDNNVYLSLLDLSRALDGTEKQFSFAYGKTQNDGEFHTVQIGEPALTQGTGITQEDPSAREDVWLVFRRNRIFVNGEDRKYYTYREGGYDLYMSLTDIQLMLDIRAETVGENAVCFYPGESFTADYAALASAGYFDFLNGYVVGDAATGRILWAGNAQESVAIASTSKLMTYLLLAEAEERGEISFDASVPLSEHAVAVSKSGDGIINFESGWSVPMRELICGMLVASSNESSVALAEYLCGSEEAFVARMNQRAQELGLTSAEFVTPNGLPVYAESAIPVKRQNRMSAEDLFRLTSYVLQHFPEITDITSQTYATMPSLSYTTANSNPLVFNLPGVTGLKTGSTVRAGQCLVASMPVSSGGETHDLVLVLLGAENASERGQMAEILLRCAKNYVEANGFF